MENLCFLTNLTSSEWASWVQAIGSVAAIYATGRAVTRAHRLQQAAKRDEERRSYTQFLEGLFQVIGGARQIARKIEQHEIANPPPTPDERLTQLAELEAVSEALRRVDYARLDQYAFVEGWLVADAVIRKLRASMEFVGRPEYSPMLEGGYLRRVATESLNELQKRLTVLEAAIRERGGNAHEDAVPF